jgi:hypothetical protein
VYNLVQCNIAGQDLLVDVLENVADKCTFLGLEICLSKGDIRTDNDNEETSS